MNDPHSQPGAITGPDGPQLDPDPILPEPEGEWDQDLDLAVEGAPDDAAGTVELRAPGNTRLDSWLASTLPDVSRAEVQRWIRQGAVLVDGRPTRASDQPPSGASVTLSRPRPVPSSIQPENLPLSIVYEDEDLLVVDKAAGMTVHPGAGAHSGTLVNALLAHCGHLSVIGGEERPGIVHRLDRFTSGLLVVAKNDIAHRSLADQIARKAAGRQYLAIAWGSPSWNQAVVRAPIGRDPHHRTRMAVVPEEEGGRAAETLLDVNERLPLASVLGATLTTGRTHQIRVHCAYSGYPLVGDPVYSQPKSRTSGIKDPQLRAEIEALARQALHACKLSFIHPRTGRHMEFYTDPPADWESILDLLRRATNG